MPISADEHSAALANLFPDAAAAVDRSWALGRLEARASVVHSSQALCVSLLETIAARPPEACDQLLNSLLEAAGLAPPSLASASTEAEVRTHRDLLNELGAGTPTALDGLITWNRGVVTIES